MGWHKSKKMSRPPRQPQKQRCHNFLPPPPGFPPLPHYTHNYLSRGTYMYPTMVQLNFQQQLPQALPLYNINAFRASPPASPMASYFVPVPPVFFGNPAYNPNRHGLPPQDQPMLQAHCYAPHVPYKHLNGAPQLQPETAPVLSQWPPHGVHEPLQPPTTAGGRFNDGISGEIGGGSDGGIREAMDTENAGAGIGKGRNGCFIPRQPQFIDVQELEKQLHLDQMYKLSEEGRPPHAPYAAHAAHGAQLQAPNLGQQQLQQQQEQYAVSDEERLLQIQAEALRKQPNMIVFKICVLESLVQVLLEAHQNYLREQRNCGYLQPLVTQISIVKRCLELELGALTDLMCLHPGPANDVVMACAKQITAFIRNVISMYSDF